MEQMKQGVNIAMYYLQWITVVQNDFWKGHKLNTVESLANALFSAPSNVWGIKIMNGSRSSLISAVFGIRLISPDIIHSGWPVSKHQPTGDKFTVYWVGWGLVVCPKWQWMNMVKWWNGAVQWCLVNLELKCYHCTSYSGLTPEARPPWWETTCL